jgi:hypothetical protein
MKHGYYLDKSKKLEKSLAAYLQKMKKPLLQRYGEKKADSIIEKSRKFAEDEKTVTAKIWGKKGRFNNRKVS